MTLLPIVERELRVASRRRNVYWGRVATALIATVVLSWVTLLVMPALRVSFSESGAWIFRNLVVAVSVYGCIGGVTATADSLSREKRNGTLGLLFLTDLRGYDVVLGKLVAGVVRSLYAMLAVVPVLAVVMAMGGVTYGDLWRATAAVGNIIFLSLVVGMSVSAVSNHERKALFGGLVVLLTGLLAPWVAMFFLLEFNLLPVGTSEAYLWVAALLNPFYPVVRLAWLPAVPVVGGQALLPPVWGSIALLHAVGWLLLMFTWRLAPRVWQAPQTLHGWRRVSRIWEQWMYGQGTSRVRLRERLLEVNPFLWVLQRERGKPVYAWVYLVVILLAWGAGDADRTRMWEDAEVAIPSLVLVLGFLKVWVISEGVARLSSDRRGGAMELLLTTPLSHEGILEGHWLALRRLFLGPLLGFAVFTWWVMRHALSSSMGWVAALTLVLDVVGVAWAAMWFGLTSSGPNRALLWTTGLLLAAPWVLVGLWLSLAYNVWPWWGAWVRPSLEHGIVAWCVAGVLLDVLVGLIWCRTSLQRSFRRIASEGDPRGFFVLK